MFIILLLFLGRFLVLDTGGETRTLIPKARKPKSRASTNFATPAKYHYDYNKFWTYAYKLTRIIIFKVKIGVLLERHLWKEI